jgi:hypothetical protein
MSRRACAIANHGVEEVGRMTGQPGQPWEALKMTGNQSTAEGVEEGLEFHLYLKITHSKTDSIEIIYKT